MVKSESRWSLKPESTDRNRLPPPKAVRLRATGTQSTLPRPLYCWGTSIRESSNGRTLDFGSCYCGSSPHSRTNCWCGIMAMRSPCKRDDVGSSPTTSSIWVSSNRGDCAWLLTSGRKSKVGSTPTGPSIPGSFNGRTADCLSVYGCSSRPPGATVLYVLRDRDEALLAG